MTPHPDTHETVKLMKFVAVFAVGGAELQFVKLALSLDPSRFAVHFGCMRRWGQLLEQIDERGIPVVDYSVFTFRNLKAVRAQLRLARDIRRRGIQIVHTYNFYANVFAIPAARLAGARVVANICDIGAYLTPRQRLVQRLVCRLADRIVVNAKAIKDWLIADGYAADRIIVIPNGLDPGLFQQVERTGTLHKEFRLPADAPLIGVIGRLAPLKGLEYFLRAAAVVASRFPLSRFLIVGEEVPTTRGESVTTDGIYTRELMRQTAQLGLQDRVVFTGFRSDVERLLPELTVSVQPSLSEGLSNTLLESMAARVPVVSTSVGGAVEVVQDGENGLLVPPSDPDSLANAICRLLAAPDFAVRLGQAGRQSVADRFSMKGMVETTSNLYESLLPSNGHRQTRKLPFDALVLDAGLRQSLVTIRSLGRRGRSVAALETHSDVPAFSSRWCQGKFVCPTDYATDAYLAYLEELLESTGARVLIPSHDGTIALLRRYRARLERRVRIALANEPALSVAVNKERTMAVASRLGIRVPAGVIVSSVDDVSLALKEIGLPAVVKPNESWICDEKQGVRVNSQLVTTADEARRAVAELTRFGASALFQRLLSGRREAVSILYANGEVYARFAQWAKRTSPPLGGESVLRQSIPMPQDIGTQSERLVREIDLDGYSEVEFRRDSAGVPYLMEINPRLSASVEIAVRSGVDFPHLVYQWASGEPIEKIESYRVGGWMRHLKGDIMTTVATLRQKGRPGIARPAQAVLGFSSSFFKPMAYDYLDWGDPLPAVRASAGFARYALQRLFRRHA